MLLPAEPCLQHSSATLKQNKTKPTSLTQPWLTKPWAPVLELETAILQGAIIVKQQNKTTPICAAQLPVFSERTTSKAGSSPGSSHRQILLGDPGLRPTQKLPLAAVGLSVCAAVCAGPASVPGPLQ